MDHSGFSDDAWVAVGPRAWVAAVRRRADGAIEAALPAAILCQANRQLDEITGEIVLDDGRRLPVAGVADPTGRLRLVRRAATPPGPERLCQANGQRLDLAGDLTKDAANLPTEELAGARAELAAVDSTDRDIH